MAGGPGSQSRLAGRPGSQNPVGSWAGQPELDEWCAGAFPDSPGGNEAYGHPPAGDYEKSSSNPPDNDEKL